MKKQNLSQKAAYWLGVVAIGLVFGMGLQIAQSWVTPPPNPPTSDIGAPLNTSDAHQTKEAGLTLNSSGTSRVGLTVDAGVDAAAVFKNGNVRIYERILLFNDDNTDYATIKSSGAGVMNAGLSINTSAVGDAFYIKNDGSIGIGDTTPDNGLKLDVEGKVGATEYCDQNGNNCRSSLGGGGFVYKGSCTVQNVASGSCNCGLGETAMVLEAGAWGEGPQWTCYVTGQGTAGVRGYSAGGGNCRFSCFGN